MKVFKFFRILNEVLNNLELIKGLRRDEKDFYMYVDEKKLGDVVIARDLNVKIIPASRIKNCQEEVFLLGGYKEDEYKDIYLA